MKKYIIYIVGSGLLVLFAGSDNFDVTLPLITLIALFILFVDFIGFLQQVVTGGFGVQTKDRSQNYFYKNIKTRSGKYDKGTSVSAVKIRAIRKNWMQSANIDYLLKANVLVHGRNSTTDDHHIYIRLPSHSLTEKYRSVVDKATLEGGMSLEVSEPTMANRLGAQKFKIYLDYNTLKRFQGKSMSVAFSSRHENDVEEITLSKNYINAWVKKIDEMMA